MIWFHLSFSEVIPLWKQKLVPCTCTLKQGPRTASAAPRYNDFHRHWWHFQEITQTEEWHLHDFTPIEEKGKKIERFILPLHSSPFSTGGDQVNTLKPRQQYLTDHCCDEALQQADLLGLALCPSVPHEDFNHLHCSAHQFQLFSAVLYTNLGYALCMLTPTKHMKKCRKLEKKKKPTQLSFKIAKSSKEAITSLTFFYVLHLFLQNTCTFSYICYVREINSNMKLYLLFSLMKNWENMSCVKFM